MNKVGIWRRCRIVLFGMRGSGEYRGHGGRILTVIMDREEIGLHSGCGERVPSFVSAFYALPFICDWPMRSDCATPCRTRLCSASPVAVDMPASRRNFGVSFLSRPEKSGIIATEGRSWIQSSKSAGSNGAQARKGRCNAFEIIEYRKLNLVMIMCGTGSKAR